MSDARGWAHMQPSLPCLIPGGGILIVGGMATQPLDTAKVYALTAAGACSVTLTQGEKSITWEALAEGGQTSFVVPAGATVSISDETALLSPLPANFKAALGADAAGAGGERIITAPMSGTTAQAEMKHATWITLPTETSACTIIPSDNGKAASMQLLLTPADDMPDGWLTAQGSVIIWPYGEPMLAGGFRYCITVVQLPWGILANMTPLGAQQNA